MTHSKFHEQLYSCVYSTPLSAWPAVNLWLLLILDPVEVLLALYCHYGSMWNQTYSAALTTLFVYVKAVKNDCVYTRICPWIDSWVSVTKMCPSKREKVCAFELGDFRRSGSQVQLYRHFLCAYHIVPDVCSSVRLRRYRWVVSEKLATVFARFWCSWHLWGYDFRPDPPLTKLVFKSQF